MNDPNFLHFFLEPLEPPSPVAPPFSVDDQFSFEANSSEISASKGFLSVASSLLRGKGFLGESDPMICLFF